MVILPITSRVTNREGKMRRPQRLAEDVWQVRKPRHKPIHLCKSTNQ